MSTRGRRVCAWIVGAVCLLTILGLIAAALFDLHIGDSTASVVAGVAAVIGLAISVIGLITNGASTGSGSGRTVRAHGRRAVAAGGSIRGNAFGRGSRATGPASDPAAEQTPAGQQDVSARGTEAMSAGGDIADNAVGEDSER